MFIDLRQLFDSIIKLFRTIEFKIGDTEVSLSALFQLLFSLVVVFLITRSLRNFLRNNLLVKLGINQGSREAISNLVGYAIGTIGFVIILQTTGFDLSSLAVLAGALGIGIGFGLQDITKNFVSGLTLLIERNIRAGDFVEFDGLEGYVKEISTRSTLIQTEDGGEVIVPNSQLAENRLINWSYESYVARIHIPVNVAYSSDTVLVTEALLRSAYMEPCVVREPQPQVIFIGFGESALNFELWVWIDRIDRRHEIRSSLNFIIDYNLRQLHIQIPFPQQDLWLRNPEAIPSMFSNPDPGKTAVLPPDKPSSGLKVLRIRDLLKQVTYFSSLNDLELRRLIEIGYIKRLKPKEVLFHENDAGDAFYIILSGTVEVIVEKISKSLASLNAGQFFGELSLMLGIPRTATVQALEETVLFSINRIHFEKLVQEHSGLYEAIVEELSKHKEELTQRQQQLRELGLLDEAEDDSNPVIWVRKRLQKLFSLQS